MSQSTAKLLAITVLPLKMQAFRQFAFAFHFSGKQNVFCLNVVVGKSCEARFYK